MPWNPASEGAAQMSASASAAIWAAFGADRIMPGLPWARVPGGGLAGCDPRGRAVIRIWRDAEKTKAELIPLDYVCADDARAFVLHDASGAPPRLGSLERAADALEGVLVCGGKFAPRSRWRWAGRPQPSAAHGTWLPGPANKFATEVQMAGRRGLWIVARSSRGITVSRDARNAGWLHQPGDPLTPLLFARWEIGMDHAETEDAR